MPTQTHVTVKGDRIRKIEKLDAQVQYLFERNLSHVKTENLFGIQELLTERFACTRNEVCNVFFRDLVCSFNFLARGKEMKYLIQIVHLA